MLGAVIPAAGQSRRMGLSKINLPWGNSTVLGKTVQTLLDGGVDDLVIVTGEVSPDGSENWPAGNVRCVRIEDAQAGDMLGSVRLGLRCLRRSTQAALIMPADMPGVPLEVVQAVALAWRQGRHALVVPSYQMRRGHPWLAARSLWADILALQPGQTLRDFLRQRAGEIHYLPVSTPGILFDLDSPDDYLAARPPKVPV